MWASSHSEVLAFFPESCMKEGKWWLAICYYKQPHKNPCVSSIKLKQSIKDSLCYSELIYIHFRPNEPSYITGIVDLLCMRNDKKKS